MTDRKISAGSAAAWGLWMATVMLLIAGVAFENMHVASFGLAVSAAAATGSIRCFFVRQNQMIRDAFDLGREAGVRNLR